MCCQRQRAFRSVTDADARAPAARRAPRSVHEGHEGEEPPQRGGGGVFWGLPFAHERSSCARAYDACVSMCNECMCVHVCVGALRVPRDRWGG